uniref:Uncharacterized protein n=1 Tax=Tetrabaena socialis TaxID=47790 RepID=A0A1B1FK38_9CHLO|nr:hypothetical protein [Tetrabaena socialis]
MENIKQRKHIFVKGTYETKKSILVIKCSVHDIEHTTTFDTYNRSQNGCPICGRKQVSSKLMGRKFSEETIKKMTIASNQRPNRGGKPRHWRKNHAYSEWRKAVFQDYNNECAVTGVKKQKPGDLIVHHLNCVKNHVHLAFIPQNGIVLERSIHNNYHKKYGYGNNTVTQFKTFLLFLLEQQKNLSTQISSQANPEGLEGPETRAYELNRLMKLHEHLGRVELILKG